ncbi:MAG TPA: PAS domain S-box protein [Flavisolibacter sp.]|nr:PAS domain S-box protein [Flavisolibacter sp.]
MDYYKASEAQYKDLFDNAHDLIYFATTDGRLLYVNKAWARVLEYEPSELQGKLIFEIVEESALDKFLTYRKAILEGRDADKDIIITVKTKSGKKIYLEGFVSLKLREGNPLYTQGIFRDVTQRLENEAKLKSINEKLLEREHNLQQLLLNAPDAVIVIDHESKIRFWNPKAAHIFGWTQDEVIGESLAEKIIPHQHRQAHEVGMKRFLLTGEAHVINRTIEITALRKNGEEFYVSLTISTTRQNGAVAFIAFLRDITEQKSNGLKLEEKTRQLEVSNQQLEQFAHIASHDMKEPIRKAIMYSGMLQTEFDHLLPDKGKLYLNKVQTANDRLSKMVEGILTYSGISSNQEPVETIELKQILDSIMNDLELIIHKKNAEISFNNLPEFEGIPFLIYQLFYNLISNH